MPKQRCRTCSKLMHTCTYMYWHIYTYASPPGKWVQQTHWIEETSQVIGDEHREIDLQLFPNFPISPHCETWGLCQQLWQQQLFSPLAGAEPAPWLRHMPMDHGHIYPSQPCAPAGSQPHSTRRAAPVRGTELLTHVGYQCHHHPARVSHCQSGLSFDQCYNQIQHSSMDY